MCGFGTRCIADTRCLNHIKINNHLHQVARLRPASRANSGKSKINEKIEREVSDDVWRHPPVLNDTQSPSYPPPNPRHSTPLRPTADAPTPSLSPPLPPLRSPASALARPPSLRSSCQLPRRALVLQPSFTAPQSSPGRELKEVAKFATSFQASNPLIRGLFQPHVLAALARRPTRPRTIRRPSTSTSPLRNVTDVYAPPVPAHHKLSRVLVDME
ncbi:hypothetical protein R3P38DRAFT_3598967 [Favolaschia claudopus]|uniref:Uncharacterized protein n=1 Tax=Favolaschia claudopus TaxID=2862362 RepID=A0AAW0AER4_9AGAR